MAELGRMLSPATSVRAGFLGLAIFMIYSTISITHFPYLMLFKVDLPSKASIDPNVCIGVSMILLGAAMLVSYLRNRRSRHYVDPLRNE